MPYSQFDDVLTARPDKKGRRELPVGGPLHLQDKIEYVWPIRVQFSIIQNPEDKPGPDHAVRAGGVVEIWEPTDRWEGVVDIGSKKFRTGEARGVAVATLEQEGRFAIETLTWCDHVKLEL